MNHSLDGAERLRLAIVRVLALELKVSEERILRARSLKSELGFDSIAAANATFALEDEFAVEFEIGEEDLLDTVDDLLALLCRALSGDPSDG